MSTAIQVRNLSKCYRINHAQPRGSNNYRTLRETLTDAAMAPLRRLRNPSAPGKIEDFWALRDISFDVEPGEVLGLIGRNGAGKSTLLKILTQITEPTSGQAVLRGRVGSLLEVGTGFHPELTGRENVYLNGSVLGMKREEIRRQFDRIVDFSGVEKFLDTPVKRYSSGMKVRLAFAVAAHLQPEILLVDEVLAVGDAEFQRKCLGKMQDVVCGGRTIIFVSHNMIAMRSLCRTVMHLKDGRIAEIGDSAEVIHRYLEHTLDAKALPEMELQNWPNRYGSGDAKIVRARLLDDEGGVTGIFRRTQPMTVEFEFQCNSRSNLNLSAVCISSDGTKVLHLSHQDCAGFEPDVVLGSAVARFRIPALPLMAGDYSWTLCVHTEFLLPLDVVFDVLPFAAEDIPDSPRPFKSLNKYGYCYTPAQWNLDVR